MKSRIVLWSTAMDNGEAGPDTRLLVDVPVQAVVLQHEPVLLPFVGEVSLGVPLPPQPALAVAPAQRLAGDASPAQRGQTPSWETWEKTDLSSSIKACGNARAAVNLHVATFDCCAAAT